MSTSRLSGIAALGALALVLTGCAGEQATTVGVTELRLATLGTVDASQQAFIDRMNELSEGSVTLNVTENWTPSGGDGSPEDALAQAVAAGDVDIAWIPIRSLGALGVKGIDAIEAPMLIQTHDQQRAVALGVPGELITTSLRKTKATALALLPGPEQYIVSSGAPIVDPADWGGKTVQISGQNPLEAAAIQALGATPADGGGSIADLVNGSAQATTGDPSELVTGGATDAGPYMTSNVALWPQMSVVLMNRDVQNRLSNRQHGFLDGAVVRAQDVAMTEPDIATIVSDACKAGVKFGTASADQLEALVAAVQPVYATLTGDPTENKLLEAIQDTVKKNAGNGAFTVKRSCRWKAPE